MNSTKKKIELVFSERGDSWIEDVEIDHDQSIRELLISKGYELFIVEGVDIDNSEMITDGMVVRVLIKR